MQRRVILVEGNIERKIYDSYTRLTSSKRIQAQTDTLPNLIFMRHGKKEVEGEGNTVGCIEILGCCYITPREAIYI